MYNNKDIVICKLNWKNELVFSDRNLTSHHQGEERISIIKSWRQGGPPANENKQNRHLEMSFSQLGTVQHCLEQCGKEGVVLYGLHSHAVTSY